MPPDSVQAALEIARAGSLRGDSPGRHDNQNISVPSESFVIPSDTVSAIGQGNTEAGFKVLEAMFPPAPVARNKGGAVPIVAANGEFIVSPEQVARLGGGDLKRGHGVLRAFVKHARAEHIKTLKGLPGPARG